LLELVPGWRRGGINVRRKTVGRRYILKGEQEREREREREQEIETKD